jgi:hypothetical protein
MHFQDALHRLGLLLTIVQVPVVDGATLNDVMGNADSEL